MLAGDEGLGRGSRALYRILVERLPEYGADTLVFHYLLPDSDWHNKILFVIQGLKRRPKLIADAGYMYVAKMAGFATEYDLFTPDVGELAFLADEAAPHPFYTRGFLLYEDERVPELIQRAYAHQNASQCMLVKGKRDYVVKDGAILHVVEEPLVESLEAIGGTGDTITGMVSLLVDSGTDPVAASLLAAKANRLAGLLSDPTPATQVVSILERIPEALARLA
ncbi:MAG: NAD(P)H-hydrate dehydratase [Desulfatiglandales bacterium]